MKDYDEIHLEAIDTVLNYGEPKSDRTSVGGNYSYFGYSYHYNIQKNNDTFTMPFLQERIFAPRIAFWELMWMLNGYTDSGWLKDKNINIWNGNTTREFLDSRGLHDVPEGNIGKGYGYQMRNFNGVDQLEEIYNNLKNNPTDRRHVISLWNPSEVNETALPPCHVMYTFSVNNGTLHLHQQQRSADLIFGAPYNIAFSSMWLVFFAVLLDLKPGKVFHTMTDMHIYDNQLDVANEMIKNPQTLDTLPKIKIHKDLNTLDDVLSLTWDDIEVIDFTKGPRIGNAKMAV